MQKEIHKYLSTIAISLIIDSALQKSRMKYL